MDARENLIRAVRFEKPDHIPMTFHINAACWEYYPHEALCQLIEADLLDCGLDVLNLQDLVNGIDWIAENLKGKVCIDLDIDRQSATARGSPEQIEALIRREVETLGDGKGGLMMIYGLYPGVPLANVQSVMDAMEKYATY